MIAAFLFLLRVYAMQRQVSRLTYSTTVLLVEATYYIVEQHGLAMWRCKWTYFSTSIVREVTWRQAGLRSQALKPTSNLRQSVAGHFRVVRRSSSCSRMSFVPCSRPQLVLRHCCAVTTAVLRSWKQPSREYNTERKEARLLQKARACTVVGQFETRG